MQLKSPTPLSRKWLFVCVQTSYSSWTWTSSPAVISTRSFALMLGVSSLLPAGKASVRPRSFFRRYWETGLLPRAQDHFTPCSELHKHILALEYKGKKS